MRATVDAKCRLVLAMVILEFWLRAANTVLQRPIRVTLKVAVSCCRSDSQDRGAVSVRHGAVSIRHGAGGTGDGTFQKGLPRCARACARCADRPVGGPRTRRPEVLNRSFTLVQSPAALARRSD